MSARRIAIHLIRILKYYRALYQLTKPSSTAFTPARRAAKTTPANAPVPIFSNVILSRFGISAIANPAVKVTAVLIKYLLMTS